LDILKFEPETYGKIFAQLIDPNLQYDLGPSEADETRRNEIESKNLKTVFESNIKSHNDYANDWNGTTCLIIVIEKRLHLSCRRHLYYCRYRCMFIDTSAASNCKDPYPNGIPFRDRMTQNKITSRLCG
jgi:hypothetical protein